MSWFQCQLIRPHQDVCTQQKYLLDANIREQPPTLAVLSCRTSFLRIFSYILLFSILQFASPSFDLWSKPLHILSLPFSIKFYVAKIQKTKITAKSFSGYFRMFIIFRKNFNFIELHYIFIFQASLLDVFYVHLFLKIFFL